MTDLARNDSIRQTRFFWETNAPYEKTLSRNLDVSRNMESHRSRFHHVFQHTLYRPRCNIRDGGNNGHACFIGQIADNRDLDAFFHGHAVVTRRDIIRDWHKRVLEIRSLVRATSIKDDTRLGLVSALGPRRIWRIDEISMNREETEGERFLKRVPDRDVIILSSHEAT